MKASPVRLAWGLLLVVAVTWACSEPPARRSGEGGETPGVDAMPNPAHARCLADGYEVAPVMRDGIPVDAECVDRATGARCPVWEYFRGDCRLGGTQPAAEPPAQ